MPRQLGASLQSERGSLPEQRESDNEPQIHRRRPLYSPPHRGGDHVPAGACAAEVLRDDPERAAAESEVIAHHFTEAGLDELAIEWWAKAGDKALRRSAFQEGISARR